MTQQGNRTQQLIYRTSYRKHRERLADIRHNITTNDFLPPKQPKKPFLKEKNKKDEIESDNIFIKTKINAIKNRNSNKLQQLFRTQQVKKQSKRYSDQGHQTKMQITTDLNDGENIKFVLPSSKHNSFSFNVRSKDAPKNQINPITNKVNSIEKCYKKYISNSLLKEPQKDLIATKQKQLYELPQRNEARVVVYKKTLILSSMQSCLLELSIINSRLLIVAYMMGMQSGTLRQLLTLKRTTEVLREFENNYEEVCGRIVIQKAHDKYLAIRIMPREEEREKIVSQEEKNKQKAKIQNQFIKRNYYTLGKNQQQLKAQSQKQKVSNVSFQHIQAVVERLAAPKRLFKLRQLDKAQRQRGFSDYEKRHKNNQYSHQQLPPFKKIQSFDKKQHQTPMNKLNQVQTQTNITKDKIDTNFNTVKQSEKKNQQQQEQYEDEEFDNPSQLKQNKKSLQKLKIINDSSFLKKSNNSNNNKMKQSSLKNQSEIYETQFEKEQCKQQLENSNISPQKETKNEFKAKQSGNVDEQYEQQFSS